uniref:Uncharacterized protein n=2 Tax=Picea TaxID=3328 RepID=A0A101LXC8_PICGL|nr:hypothetical protein ABT39_MTgene6102 [Picea glauca]QHR92604.1 hypothetical protein Q903MT_gene6651 [Picea sitchensis]
MPFYPTWAFTKYIFPSGLDGFIPTMQDPLTDIDLLITHTIHSFLRYKHTELTQRRTLVERIHTQITKLEGAHSSALIQPRNPRRDRIACQAFTQSNHFHLPVIRDRQTEIPTPPL